MSLAPAAGGTEWLIRLWCAKEAVAKALGRGMAGGPWNVVIWSVDLQSGLVGIRLAGALAAAMPHHRDTLLLAYTGRTGELAYAPALVA